MSLAQKEVVDSIKGMCNNFSSAVFWHDGKADDHCQFIGLHIHLLVGSPEQLSRVYNYRNMSQRLCRHGSVIKSQKVRNIDALTHHLLEPPRTLFGCNHMQLCGLINRLSKIDKDGDMGYADLDINFNKEDEPVIEQSVVETASAINWIRKRLTTDHRRG